MDTLANVGNCSTPLRFRLRTLFLAIALLSIPLTLLHWLGSYFVFPILFSACLVGVCSWYYRPDAPKKVLGIAGLAVPVGLMFSIFYLMVSFRFGGAGTLILHTVINALVCLACVGIKCPRKVIIPVLIVAAVVPYYFRIEAMQKVRRQFDQLLADYPLESLEARLSFEDVASEARVVPASVEQLSPEVAGNLTKQADRFTHRRQWSLEALHENFEMQFAAAAGFGYMRMARVWPDDLEPEPVEIAKLPIAVSERLLGENGSDHADALHQTVAFDFLNLGKTGYVRDRRHVAGFQPHSPTDLTSTIDNQRSCGQPKVEVSHWQLTRLELVSLLRHSPPRVYVADSLPAMDQLDQFEHRAVTEFEETSLPKLYTEADVVTEQGDDRILMLGALRASQDCLACHQGNQGKLLGAFSYEFARYDSSDGEAQKIADTRPVGGFHASLDQP